MTREKHTRSRGQRLHRWRLIKKKKKREEDNSLAYISHVYVKRIARENYDCLKITMAAAAAAARGLIFAN